ncbi:MAG: glycosyltransferase family 2 protein [Phycisphaerales bacterium]|nr:glycosyltransferase family 2 protein [Phycisphaerales bacterium]
MGGHTSQYEPLDLSIAIVCKNNQATIGRTLGSVRGLASEIVAVDSGSTDQTIPMLEAAGARVINSPWLGHVLTKQLALQSCTRAWALCLDSDESPEPALAASIREAIDRNEPAVLGYRVNRMVWYRGRPLRHTWQPEWRLRLVRRGAAKWTGLDPHDVLLFIDPLGRPRDLTGVLRHDSFATFEEHFRKQVQHATTMARSLHAAGKRGSRVRLLISPPGAFIKQLVLKRGFLDGKAGWLAAATTAAGTLIKHGVLLELDSAEQPGQM